MGKEFGESTNAIRIELNRFEVAGLVKSEYFESKKYFSANIKHPFFTDINNILKKYVGIDQIIERITQHIGHLKAAYLTGNFASGLDSDTIELLLVGYDLDNQYISNLVKKAETMISRKITYLLVTEEQMKSFFDNKPLLLIWKIDIMN